MLHRKSPFATPFASVMVVLLLVMPAQAQLKPEAMVIPVYFAGIKDASARQILQQHVLTELSQSYELRSEQEIVAAREKAADKLASTDCTEVACLKVMGELLDVDHMFAVLVSASGNYWDFTGIRMEPLGRTVRKSVECPNCTLPKARAGLTELLHGLRPGAVGIERGKAVLILESEPSGLVFLEGVEQGETPIELTVPSNRPAEILVFAEGYQDYSNLFDLEPGERRTVQIRLVKRRGRVRIVSEPPGAAIFLDGQPLRDASGKQQSTPAETRLEYGRHTLRLTLEKHQDARETLTVKHSDLGTQTYTLTPNPGRLVIRVPPELKDGDVFINGQYLGNMAGKIARSFEIPSNKKNEIKITNLKLHSEKKFVKITPEASRSLTFNKINIAQKENRSNLEKTPFKLNNTLSVRVGFLFGTMLGFDLGINEENSIGLYSHKYNQSAGALRQSSNSSGLYYFYGKRDSESLLIMPVYATGNINMKTDDGSEGDFDYYYYGIQFGWNFPFIEQSDDNYFSIVPLLGFYTVNVTKINKYTISYWDGYSNTIKQAKGGYSNMFFALLFSYTFR